MTDATVDVKPTSQRLVRHGGLMRCCLLTIATSDEPSTVGSTLECVYENNGRPAMVVAADGVWEWVGPA